MQSLCFTEYQSILLNTKKTKKKTVFAWLKLSEKKHAKMPCGSKSKTRQRLFIKTKN
jgi:hypothetical protein